MNVIAPRTIRDFIERYPESEISLRDWYNTLRRDDYLHFAALRDQFVVDTARNSEKDTVHIFDVAGNHYRVICYINFGNQTAFIKYVFTHREYDLWNDDGRPA